MSPESIMRDGAARHAVIASYESAAAHHDAEQRRLRSEGKHELATIERGALEISERAWRAEKHDPKPKDPAP